MGGILKYNIGSVGLEIILPYKLFDDECYKLFASTSCVVNINVEVLLAEKEFVLPKVSDNTNYWQSCEDGYILFFGSRGVKLNESNTEDLWYLCCDCNFSRCRLYISSKYINNPKLLAFELFHRLWIQKLYAAYVGMRNRMIMHGAGIMLDNKCGVLVLGNSGSGKSTACKIMKGENAEPISDDRVLVEIREDTLWCYGTPWNYKNPHMIKNTKVKIEKIIFVSHGQNEYYLCESFANFNSKFANQILHSDVYPTIDIVTWKIGLALRIYKNIQAYDMAFRPDASFAECLRRLVRGGGCD